jgi:hypothetical protein
VVVPLLAALFALGLAGSMRNSRWPALAAGPLASLLLAEMMPGTVPTRLYLPAGYKPLGLPFWLAGVGAALAAATATVSTWRTEPRQGPRGGVRRPIAAFALAVAVVGVAAAVVSLFLPEVTGTKAPTRFDDADHHHVLDAGAVLLTSAVLTLLLAGGYARRHPRLLTLALPVALLLAGQLMVLTR